MSKLTDYLAAVRARCEKATKGPWMAEGEWIAAEVDGGRPNGEVIARMSGSADHLSQQQRQANAELTAHSRTDVEVLGRMVEAFVKYCESRGPGAWCAERILKEELEFLVPAAEEEKQ